jgi:hypothetical protein
VHVVVKDLWLEDLAPEEPDSLLGEQFERLSDAHVYRRGFRVEAQLGEGATLRRGDIAEVTSRVELGLGPIVHDIGSVDVPIRFR